MCGVYISTFSPCVSVFPAGMAWHQPVKIILTTYCRPRLHGLLLPGRWTNMAHFEVRNGPFLSDNSARFGLQYGPNGKALIYSPITRRGINTEIYVHCTPVPPAGQRVENPVAAAHGGINILLFCPAQGANVAQNL